MTERKMLPIWYANLTRNIALKQKVGNLNFRNIHLVQLVDIQSCSCYSFLNISKLVLYSIHTTFWRKP